jgi:hypothetical protein
MEIEKSTNHYTLYKTALNHDALVSLYNQFKDQMTKLDLSKKFNQYSYKHSDLSNPQWLNLKIEDHAYLKTVINIFGIADIKNTINLSLLPAGFELANHTDIGRRTVLLIPIIGVNSPINILNETVYYNNNCLLLDSTIMHSVPTTDSDRVTLQFAFRQRYNSVVKKVNDYLTNEGN